MKKRFVKFLLLLGLGTWFAACQPATPPPIVVMPSSPIVVTPTGIVSSPTPSPSATTTLEPTATPTLSPSSPPVIASTGRKTQIPIMPEALLDEASTQLGTDLSQLLGQEVISYNMPASLEAVRDFYQTELAAQGWEWVYTDMGESLALSRSIQILVQEFKQGSNRLAVGRRKKGHMGTGD